MKQMGHMYIVIHRLSIHPHIVDQVYSLNLNDWCHV